MKTFKPIFINATTLDDCWFQLLYQLYESGRRYKISSGSFEGHDRVAFDFVSGFIKNPHIRPLMPIMPEGSNLPAPTTDEDIEFYFSDYLMDSNLSKNEHYKYATWIVGDKEKGITNQLNWVINHFKTNGYGNEHCTIMIGGHNSCLSYDQNKTGGDETARGSTPCLRMLDFRIIDGELLTHVVYRSWDLYGGFPVNMGGFTLLNEYVACQLENVEPGPLSFSCKSLHCYDFHLEIIKQRLKKE